jgi:DNA-binding NarL/FixJ family response regulator
MKDILELISKAAPAVVAVGREQRIVVWNRSAENPLEFKAEEGQGTDPPRPIPALMNLTRREREVLQLLASGASTKAIASRLGLTPATARNHIHNIFAKLGVRSRLEAGILWLGSSAPPTPRPLVPPSSALTRREREVLRLLASGASTRAIASGLGISPATVRNHVHHILAKLGVHSRLEAVILWLRA